MSSDFITCKLRRDKMQTQVGYFYCAFDVVERFQRRPQENQFKLRVIIGFTTGD